MSFVGPPWGLSLRAALVCATAVLQTWFNSWATCRRMREFATTPCMLRGAASVDDRPHSTRCIILVSYIRKCVSVAGHNYVSGWLGLVRSGSDALCTIVVTDLLSRRLSRAGGGVLYYLTRHLGPCSSPTRAMLGPLPRSCRPQQRDVLDVFGAEDSSSAASALGLQTWDCARASTPLQSPMSIASPQGFGAVAWVRGDVACLCQWRQAGRA